VATDRGSQISIKTVDDSWEYRRIFRKRVFQLLKQGYDRLDPAAYQNAKETVITGELKKEIEAVIWDRSSPRWVSQYYVIDERPINYPGRYGPDRQRIDIELRRCERGRHPRIPFEAKRLAANTSATIGEYLGPEGLGEFLAGNYGRDEQVAGMLGYVQTHSVERWSRQANHRLSQAPDNYQLYPDCCWTSENIIPELDACYRTKHYRSSGKSPIIIIHCFLIFM
jgi:hypothetical protein